jgi:hypothetical protein
MGDTSRAETVTSGALLLSFGFPLPPTPVGGATGDDRAVA